MKLVQLALPLRMECVYVVEPRVLRSAALRHPWWDMVILPASI